LKKERLKKLGQSHPRRQPLRRMKLHIIALVRHPARRLARQARDLVEFGIGNDGCVIPGWSLIPRAAAASAGLLMSTVRAIRPASIRRSPSSMGSATAGLRRIHTTGMVAITAAKVKALQPIVTTKSLG
jgi:hypothetical protein